MKIGLVTSVFNIRQSLSELVDEVVAAEENGFDHFWFVHMPHLGYDALQLASLSGQRTDRIQLGTAIIPTYPRHPFVMAQQALTSQVATDNRLILGIGPSHDFVIRDMLGMDYARPAHHTQEYLEVITELMHTRKSNYQGEIFNMDANLWVNQSKPPSILVAALGPRMLKVAGSYSDGTITWVTGPKTLESHIVPRIHAAAAEVGKPRPRVAMVMPVMCIDDEAAGRRQINEKLGQYGAMENYRRMLEMEGAKLPGDVGVVGSPAQIEQGLRRFASLGVTDFCALVIGEPGNLDASIRNTQAVLQDLVGKI